MFIYRSICAVAVAVATTNALALPSISVVDLGDGQGQIRVTTTIEGSVAAEIALILSRANLQSAVINTAVFDTANPGDSPFILGSPEGGDVNGLVADPANNRLFASYGSDILLPGTYEFLTFTYTGFGCASATGVVAVGGVLTSGLSSGGCINEPPLQLPGDANGDGSVDLLDLAILGNNFGQSPRRFSQGNFNEPDDTRVDLLDLAILGANFGSSAPAYGAAVPEPTCLAFFGSCMTILLVQRRG